MLIFYWNWSPHNAKLFNIYRQINLYCLATWGHDKFPKNFDHQFSRVSQLFISMNASSPSYSPMQLSFIFLLIGVLLSLPSTSLFASANSSGAVTQKHWMPDMEHLTAFISKQPHFLEKASSEHRGNLPHAANSHNSGAAVNFILAMTIHVSSTQFYSKYISSF